MPRLLFLLLFISTAALAQESSLYNKHRQLIVDTSLRIDEHTYKYLPAIEDEVLPEVYNNIKISSLTQDPGKSGLVIVQLNFGKGVCTFEIVRSKQPDLESAVYLACKTLQKDYAKLRFRKWEEFSLYVPIKFELRPSTFNKLLKKNKAVTIQRELYIDRGFRDPISVTQDWISD